MYSKVLWYCSSIDNDLDENVNMDLLSQSLNCVNTTTTSTTSEATTSEAQTEATTSEAQTEDTTSEVQTEASTSEAPGSSLATVHQEGQYGVTMVPVIASIVMSNNRPKQKTEAK